MSNRLLRWARTILETGAFHPVSIRKISNRFISRVGGPSGERVLRVAWTRGDGSVCGVVLSGSGMGDEHRVMGPGTHDRRGPIRRYRKSPPHASPVQAGTAQVAVARDVGPGGSEGARSAATARLISRRC